MSIGGGLEGVQELKLARAPSSWEEGNGAGGVSMGLIPPGGPVDPACRRPVSPPVESASSTQFFRSCPRYAFRMLLKVAKAHVVRASIRHREVKKRLG